MMGLPMIAPASAAPDTLSILYADAADWRGATTRDKLTLGADFMRIFCANARMSAPLLASCIDQRIAAGYGAAILDLALTCANDINQRTGADLAHP